MSDTLRWCRSDRLVQTDDLSAAAWIAPRLGAFAVGVHGVIPAGFEAYARILHPADSADETMCAGTPSPRQPARSRTH